MLVPLSLPARTHPGVVGWYSVFVHTSARLMLFQNGISGHQEEIARKSK